MDSREKIVTAEEALERARAARQRGARVTVVHGYFDPLLEEHARRLSELAAPGGWLAAVVMEPPAPILPARARAELVAGLRVVDCVVVGDAAEWDADAVVDERAEDKRRTEQFVAHVRARAGAGA